MYEQLQEYQQQLQQPQQRQLQQFWAEQRSEIEQATDIKNHPLPLTRIRKIMKADEDVHMISAEAPALFAKASEMFTLEMTMRSWMVTKEDKRRVLQRSDVAGAVARTDIYDFLLDLFASEETKQGFLLPRAGAAAHGGSSWCIPVLPCAAAAGGRCIDGVWWPVDLCVARTSGTRAGPSVQHLRVARASATAGGALKLYITRFRVLVSAWTFSKTLGFALAFI